ncbi:unnamed protein product [Prorocentrum cordatum]|uniref:Uncharacterized protein n=1 Tax=Prorocentrum cordatum TaxID=2364126 RepID=A0ABN9SB06_9DINO|nr:unnamed protein product [Polarella glacialis]
MPASTKKAVKTKTDNCRDRKRAASIQNWLKKPWVKQYLQKAAKVHLKKYHDTVGALRKRQTELHKEVKEKKKENFHLRRDVFVHTRAAENARKNLGTAKDKNEGLRKQLRETQEERGDWKQKARTARREGEAAAWDEAEPENESLRASLKKAQAKCRGLSTEKNRFLQNASKAQQANYYELVRRPRGPRASDRDGCFGAQ